MRPIFKYLIIIVLVSFSFLSYGQKKKLELPSSYKTFTVAEAKSFIEEALNSQQKHTPASVFVGDKFYKVGYGGSSMGSTFHTRIVNKFVYYNDIGKLVLYEYPNNYNLVIYNKKGKEVNKVITKDLTLLHDFIGALKVLERANQ